MNLRELILHTLTVLMSVAVYKILNKIEVVIKEHKKTTKTPEK